MTLDKICLYMQRISFIVIMPVQHRTGLKDHVDHRHPTLVILTRMMPQVEHASLSAYAQTAARLPMKRLVHLNDTAKAAKSGARPERMVLRVRWSMNHAVQYGALSEQVAIAFRPSQGCLRRWGGA